MDECTDSLKKARIFSTLDADAGHWKFEMDENDVEKKAFDTHHGCYLYKKMPLGLKSTPATFQRAMDVILAFVN